MIAMRDVRVSFFLVLIFLVFSLGAHAGELNRFQGMEGTLDIAGGTAHIPVMKEAAQQIMTFNPKIKIEISFAFRLLM